MSKKDPNRQHAQVLVRLVKPIGATWDEAGAQLRLVRSRCAIAMTRAATDLVLEQRQGFLRKKDSPDDGTPARTRAYQLVVEHLRLQCKPAEPDISSHVALGCAGVMFARFQAHMKDPGKVGLPSFRRNQPIVVASGSDRWTLQEDDDGIALTTKLLARGNPGLTFGISACGSGAWGHLRRLLRADGCAKRGELRFRWDDRKRAWTALLSYSWEKPEHAKGTATVALHRGVGTFLVAVSSSGESTIVDDGADLRRAKLAFSKRIGRLRRHLSTNAGSGARGHGRKRRFKALETMRGREERWSDTRCKQDAARLIALCGRWGASRIVLPDITPAASDEATKARLGERVAWFVERFPFYRLTLAIETAAERAGIDVAKVVLGRDATTCPACGNVDARQADHKAHRFVCLHCLFEDHLDIAACFNLLRRSGNGADVEHILAKRAAWSAAARKAKRRKHDVRGVFDASTTTAG